jgi:hypothetical protein
VQGKARSTHSRGSAVTDGRGGARHERGSGAALRRRVRPGAEASAESCAPRRARARSSESDARPSPRSRPVPDGIPGSRSPTPSRRRRTRRRATRRRFPPRRRAAGFTTALAARSARSRPGFGLRHRAHAHGELAEHRPGYSGTTVAALLELSGAAKRCNVRSAPPRPARPGPRSGPGIGGRSRAPRARLVPAAGVRVGGRRSPGAAIATGRRAPWAVDGEAPMWTTRLCWRAHRGESVPVCTTGTLAH